MTARDWHVPEELMRHRRGFTLVELLTVLAIIAILLGLLLPGVQKVREAANRLRCENNLKQFGLAMHNYDEAVGNLPPGLVTWGTVEDGAHTGFTYMLPYLEQEAVYREYDLTQQWYAKQNYPPIAVPIPLFYCPSNRTSGTMALSNPLFAWGWPPGETAPTVASTDYILCKGANAAIHQSADLIPPACRGVFNVYADMSNPDFFAPYRAVHRPPGGAHDRHHGRHVQHLRDRRRRGASPRYVLRQMTTTAAGYSTPNAPAIDPYTGGTIQPDQAWAAGSIAGENNPWSASIFGVTAQYGLPDLNGYRDEPMNNPLVMPSAYADTDFNPLPPGQFGYNRTGFHYISGFRSMHPGGCNFLFCDGSVHWVSQTIQPAIYRALSTYAGGEVVPADAY